MGSLVTHSFPNTVAVARLVLTILGQGRERFIVVLIVFVVAGVEAGPLLGLKWFPLLLFSSRLCTSWTLNCRNESSTFAGEVAAVRKFQPLECPVNCKDNQKHPGNLSVVWSLGSLAASSSLQHGNRIHQASERGVDGGKSGQEGTWLKCLAMKNVCFGIKCPPLTS